MVPHVVRIKLIDVSIMDPEKTLKFITSNLAGYLTALAGVLAMRQPINRFPPKVSEATGSYIELPGHSPSRTLNPELLAFAAISVIVGSSFLVLVFPERDRSSLFQASLVTILFWFLYSATTVFVAWVIRRRTEFLDAVSIGVQTLAAVHVVSSVVSVIALALWNPSEADFRFGSATVLSAPAAFYFLTQSLLLCVYLSLVLAKLYGFRRAFSLLVSLIATAGWVSLNISMFLAYPRGPMAPPPKQVGGVIYFIDTSGSMDAELLASCWQRLDTPNDEAIAILFSDIATALPAQEFAQELGTGAIAVGGGTELAAAVRFAIHRGDSFDTIVVLSDLGFGASLHGVDFETAHHPHRITTKSLLVYRVGALSPDTVPFRPLERYLKRFFEFQSFTLLDCAEEDEGSL